MAYAQYFGGLFTASVPNAAIVDTTPPTFAGIASVTPGTDGSISASWALATDATAPINYLVYIALGTVNAAALFVPANLAEIIPAGNTTGKVFMLGDQATYLVNGLTYTLGVRAVDGVGNVDSNVALISAAAVSSGNLPSILSTTTTQLQAVLNQLSAVYVIRNMPLPNFEFPLQTFSGVPLLGAVVTATRSIDGGAPAPCANPVSEVGGGLYKIDLAAADMNGRVIGLQFSAVGAQLQTVTIVTQA